VKMVWDNITQACNRGIGDIALSATRLQGRQMRCREARFHGSSGPAVDQLRCARMQRSAACCISSVGHRRTLSNLGVERNGEKQGNSTSISVADRSTPLHFVAGNFSRVCLSLIVVLVL
jgi:hypothetical protein